MKDIILSANSLFVSQPQLKKSVTTQAKGDLVVPNMKTTSDLPRLAIPGFNDHKVIVFGNKFAGVTAPKNLAEAYQPVDVAEKNSMDIFKSVAPSVVQLKVKSSEIVMNPQTGEAIEIPRQGSGSGSILDKEGFVLTNFHVINGAKEITVVLDKDNEVSGTLVGSDPSTDLALVKIDMPKEELQKLPVMKLGDSKEVEGGQRAFAIGNPFSLYRSVTQGIVSAIGRTIISPGGRLTKDVIQTDASLNPGNSGGALVNAKGEQIGINTQIYSPSGASAGLGFAVPIDVAKGVISELKTEGRVNRPFIGISGGIPLEALHPQLKAMLGIGKIKKGVMIQQVLPKSPAEKAGLKGGEMMIKTSQDGDGMLIGGDIIRKVNGKAVSNMTELFEIMDENKIGEKLTIEYVSLEIEVDQEAQKLKGTMSEPQTVSVTIGDTPKPKADKPFEPEYDKRLTPKPLGKDDLEEFGIKP